MIVAAIAALALLQQSDPAIEGRELVHKVIRRAETAKSIRVEAKSELTGHPAGPRSGSLHLVLRGRDEFRVTLLQDAHLIRIKSDGKTILNTGRAQVDPKTLDPANIVDWLRHRSAIAAYAALDFLEPASLAAGLPPIDKAVVEGEEKIGTVSAKIVAYALPVGGGPKVMAVRAWIDPERLVVLKREAKVGTLVLNESITVMEYDGEVNADDFAIQSLSEVRRAQDVRIAEAADLYARWMGKRPATVAELETRPDGEGFWPDGGFWIGGKLSGPVKGSGVAGASRLAAPSERLSRLFSAQIRLKLLKSAVDAYEAAYWKLPAGFADLVKKPEGVAAWPDGGFIRDEALLKDPWGEPFQFVPRRAAVVLRCSGFHERRVLLDDLAPDERVKLIVSTGTPVPAGRLPFAKLGDPDPAVREAAVKEIHSLGPGVLGAVEARLAEEKSAGVQSGLRSIRDRFWSADYAWRGLLSSPRAVSYGDSPGRPSSNENVAIRTLDDLGRAQADFRSKDPDGDHAANYWVADVAGIFALGQDKPPPRPFVFLARADATPGRRNYPVLEDLTEPEPFVGAYLTASLRHYEETDGKRVPYDDGKGRNADRFGIVVFPDEYGESGILTFILDQAGAKWSKDLGGGEIDTFPRDPATAGWRAVQ